VFTVRFVFILGLVATFIPFTVCHGDEPDQLTRDYLENGMRAAPRDAFPVLHNPEKANVDEADGHLDGNEWVIGVEVNGKARAYPVAVMGVHELINDTVGGHPITVCW
jgi:hypothetical protein